jgi:hypothetical protein
MEMILMDKLKVFSRKIGSVLEIGETTVSFAMASVNSSSDSWLKSGWNNTSGWINSGWNNTSGWINSGWNNTSRWINSGWNNTIGWINSGWKNGK